MKLNSFQNFLFLGLCLGLSFPGLASVSLPVYPRWNELTKITVGPDDQLDGSVDHQQKLLVFTHRANMVSHLRVQDLASGEVRDLLPSDADSMQAKFNDAGQIVFVYFKKSSRGEICFTDAIKSIKELPLSPNKIHCIPTESQRSRFDRKQPFWFNSQRIGFLEEENKTVRLLSVGVEKSAPLTELLAAPSLIAPAASSDGRYLVYNQIVNNESQLVLETMATQEKQIIPIALPGVSGFASFSETADYLYFSHFMGDSNLDTLIDGNDNSVVWRVSIEKIFDYLKDPNPYKEELKLEQVTPMDLNCNFPLVKSDSMFMTCAFEGSLDIYSLPPEGVVPKKWGQMTIESAFESARSYQDRILLINTLKSRFLKESKLQVLNERLFNLHLLADEVTAALFYSRYLNSIESLKIFLKARRLKKNQPLNARTFLFKESISKLEQELARVKGEENLKSFVMAYLSALSGRNVDLVRLAQKLKEASQPLYFWLYYNVAEERVPKDQAHLDEWIKILKTMIQNQVVSKESRLYYTFELLRILENSELTERQQRLVQFLKEIEPESEVDSLLQAEIHSLELILARDKKEKLKALQKIDQLLTKHKTNYFVRKSINVRVVLNFLAHQQFQQVGVIAANWLRDTPATSTEFVYAREVVIAAAREQAYNHWAKSNPRLASDYFFQSLSLTDDLESYSGYVNTMKEVGQAQPMKERLDYLRQHEVMKDGVLFVKALMGIFEGEDEKNLAQALEDLQSIRADLNDPMRTLIIGYIYLQKFHQSKNGVEYDRDLWQKAHNALILTSDLARGQKRIRAAALSNLGLLHLWGQNYGQSVRFFELRKQLGFAEPHLEKERQAFSWFYSQALFLNGQAKEAANELSDLLGPPLAPEILERRAFYLAMGDQFNDALKDYVALEKIKGTHFESLKEPSRSKVRLGYAYTLFSLQKFTEARALFESITKENLSKFDAHEGARSINFDPTPLKAMSWGFLAQMGTEAEQIKALYERLALLENEPAATMQAKMRLAELLSKTDPKKASELMQSSLSDLQALIEENGPLGQPVFRGLTNYMVHSLLFQSHYKGQNHKIVRELVPTTLKALEREGDLATPFLRREQWQLQYLWNLYQEKILNDTPGSSGLDLQWREKLGKSALTERLRAEDSVGFSQLQEQVRALE